MINLMILSSRWFLFLHPSHVPEQISILCIHFLLLLYFSFKPHQLSFCLRSLPGHVGLNLGLVAFKPESLLPGVVTASTYRGTLSYHWGRFPPSEKNSPKREGDSLLSPKEGQKVFPATPLCRVELVSGRKGASSRPLERKKIMTLTSSLYLKFRSTV